MPIKQVDDNGVITDIGQDQVTENSIYPVKSSGIYSFVNSSVATNTANFIGTYNSLADLEAHVDYQEPLTNNDYGFVVSTDAAGNTVYSRYKYSAETDTWMFEYNLNNSSFTANQWETINSGMTSTDKTKLDTIEQGANKTVVDVSLSNSSTNPVQNKVVTNSLNTKYNKDDDVTISLTDYENLGPEKYTNNKNYYIYDANEDIGVIPVVYGYHIDPNESDPSASITYLENAVGMTPVAMGSTTFSYGSWQNAFFMPKPCMVKYNGTVDYYLNPNDYSKKIDGTDSDIANSAYEGNAMVEWPLIFYKFEAGTIDGEGYFYCSNIKVDDSYNCWCNYDANGNIIEHFYTSIYNGTGTTNMRSLSGIQLTSASGNGNTSGSTEITRATANNTTLTVEWYTSVFSDRILINALHILISKTLNCEAAFGHGITSGSQSGKEAYVTGSLDNKGMFYGDISSTTTAVKTFGMENWWGLVWDRTAGCVGLTNGTTSIKLTYSTVDGTTATGYNSSGEGYINLNWTRPSAGYVKLCRYNQYGYFPINTSGASVTTYYCDYWYTNKSALTYLLVGGYSDDGAAAGFSYFYLNRAFSSAGWDVAARLSLKPLGSVARA